MGVRESNVEDGAAKNLPCSTKKQRICHRNEQLCSGIALLEKNPFRGNGGLKGKGGFKICCHKPTPKAFSSYSEGHGSWVPLSTLGYPKSPKSWGTRLRNSSCFVTRANYATSPPLATVGPWAPMLRLFSSPLSEQERLLCTGYCVVHSLKSLHNTARKVQSLEGFGAS